MSGYQHPDVDCGLLSRSRGSFYRYILAADHADLFGVCGYDYLLGNFFPGCMEGQT